MNLLDLFDPVLTGRRGEAALEWQGRTYTFGELDDRSSRLANLLRARGLDEGDRLAVYLANRVEMIDLYLACLKLGVIFVPINILYRERETAHILADAEPAGLVAAAEAPGGATFWQIDGLTADAESQPAERPEGSLDGDAPAAIVYTSGTTGRAKGAILTHNNFAANAVSLMAAWQMTATDRLLLALPLFHVHGLGNGLHCWLAAGFRMRLLERFDREKAAAEFLDFRPTVFFGVPTMYVRLAAVEETAARQIGRRARLFVSGSAPLPAQLLEDFRARYGHTILERYGMTETLMNTSNPYEGERRPGSVGLPLPGVSVKIVDGELYVRGPNVFPGYWRREEATRSAFADGWFRTGDLGVRAPDGYYTLQGRRSDVIISGGFNIYPREIEEFLLEQPEVAEAAVAGMADAARGEAPVAYVVAREGFDPAEMERRCRESLASFKVPRAFVTMDQLPRNALGKVQKHMLPKA